MDSSGQGDFNTNRLIANEGMINSSQADLKRIVYLSEALKMIYLTNSNGDTTKVIEPDIAVKHSAIVNADNASTNSAEYLETSFLIDGWRWERTDVSVALTVVYLIIFLIGVVGNICNCLVIADSKNRYMKTPTNYYLFSLSVSDLILLIFGLPHDIVNLWHAGYMFNQFVCVSRGWISEASTNASVLVIVAFTVERYFAICHPLESHRLSHLSRSVKIICLIWLVGSSWALVVVWNYGLVTMVDKTDRNGTSFLTVQCTVTALEVRIVFVLSVLIFFMIPFIVITILYIKVGCRLRRETKLHQKRPSRASSIQKQPSNMSPRDRQPPELASQAGVRMSSSSFDVASPSDSHGDTSGTQMGGETDMSNDNGKSQNLHCRVQINHVACGCQKTRHESLARESQAIELRQPSSQTAKVSLELRLFSRQSLISNLTDGARHSSEFLQNSGNGELNKPNSSKQQPHQQQQQPPNQQQQQPQQQQQRQPLSLTSNVNTSNRQSVIKMLGEYSKKLAGSLSSSVCHLSLSHILLGFS